LAVAQGVAVLVVVQRLAAEQAAERPGEMSSKPKRRPQLQQARVLI
jgi:hypothetical protein